MSADDQERIDVTVTFLEMDVPPAYYPPLPYNRQIALLKTRTIPLHFYRYLQDRVGRKWHWVNVLKLNDDELAAGLHREDRDIRVLYLDGAPAGFFDIKPHLPGEAELAYFGMMEHATGQGIGRWFLGAAIEACWSHGPKRVTVQTCTRSTIPPPCRSIRNSVSNRWRRRKRSCGRCLLSGARPASCVRAFPLFTETL